MEDFLAVRIIGKFLYSAFCLFPFSNLCFSVTYFFDGATRVRITGICICLNIDRLYDRPVT